MAITAFPCCNFSFGRISGSTPDIAGHHNAFKIPKSAPISAKKKTLDWLAIKEIAPLADLVLVVGSTNSSNSVRLVEVSLEYGAKAAYLIDYAAEAKDEWLTGVNTIGVSSGASVPEILVRDLLDWLAARGFGDVETITATEEHLLFSLPPELRKELKLAGK